MSLRIVTSSWNVNGQQPREENLDEWLHLLEEHHENLADIYVIGIQEVPSDPASLVLDYYIRNDHWTSRLLLFLSTKGIVMVESARMMGMLLIVAVKPIHLPFLREIRSTYTKTSFYGLIGIKGAVSLRFDLYGESFCFINNHFTAGEKSTEYRNNNYHAINSKTLFRNCEKQLINDHRYCINFGDFNYRIDDLDVNTVKKLIAENDFQTILDNDQLLKSKKEGKCFEDFNEHPINFSPTYKYDLNSSNFDSSLKQRTPAYTDRIFWREKTEEVLSMQQSMYSSHMAYETSDHKPISAEFIVQIPAMLSSTAVVEFKFEDSYIPWTSEEDGVCVFYVKGYQTSSWDWIGLYPIDFKSPQDYYTYEWSVSGVDETGEDGCMVLFDDVPDIPGYYIFGYWSRKLECILGLSEPFEVTPLSDPQEITVEAPAQEGENV
ncbi:phosphatidylinositol 4,5-bisphosphate 5-phosphatase A isoform X1 [Hydra vulgaris]|nr:phosphatidylinositol 4,5-bisphosphate 5-phosphatase A [Hydra vulgaris]